MTGTRQSAVTLLELLVALAIISIMTGVITAAFHFGFKAHRTARESIGPVREGRIALEAMRADVESVLPPTGILAGPFIGQDEFAGAGSLSDSVEFFTLSTRRAGDRADIVKVRYVLADAGNARRDLVREVTENLLAVEAQEPEREVICRHAKSLSLRYFDGAAWQDAWDSTAQDNQLPKAVEVALVLAESEDFDAREQTVARTFVPVCQVPPPAESQEGPAMTP